MSRSTNRTEKIHRASEKLLQSRQDHLRRAFGPKSLPPRERREDERGYDPYPIPDALQPPVR